MKTVTLFIFTLRKTKEIDNIIFKENKAEIFFLYESFKLSKPQSQELLIKSLLLTISQDLLRSSVSKKT